MTLAPRCAAIFAVARPMPDEPPVMTMVCSFSVFGFEHRRLLCPVNEGRRATVPDYGPKPQLAI